MKAKTSLTLVALLPVSALLFPASYAQDAVRTPATRDAVEVISVEELPLTVREVLTQTAKDEPVKSIHRRQSDGRTVYDVELERKNAINPRFQIAEDGVVTSGMQLGSAAVSQDALASHAYGYDGITIAPSAFDNALTAEQLPAAVRNTLKRDYQGRQISDIDRETWDGRPVYEVEFKEPGMNPQVHIAEDGTVVRHEGERRATGVGSAMRRLFLGTQLEDTPPAVQEVIRRESRTHEVRDIDAKMRNGQQLYEVEFDEGGSRFQLHIAQDGRIMLDTRQNASR